MKTSAQWWQETKNSETKLANWLQRQYTGEVTAADRIIKLGQRFNVETKALDIIQIISQQEQKHAEWIQELLVARNIEPKIENPESRYWAETLPGIVDFETGTAVAAHAEKMRLERIKVISEDEDAPEDIREVFKKILVDELWHEKAFRELSTEDALEKTKSNHELGRKVLGLEA